MGVRMSQILYQEFLNNSAVYRANRAYWFGRFWPKRRRTSGRGWSASDDKNRKRYKPYLSEKFNNNVFYEDGNPIFNLWNIETGRVARIVQLEAEDEQDRYFHVLKKKIEMAPVNTQEIVQLDELVIMLILSTDFAGEAIGQIKNWLE